MLATAKILLIVDRCPVVRNRSFDVIRRKNAVKICIQNYFFGGKSGERKPFIWRGIELSPEWKQVLVFGQQNSRFDVTRFFENIL